MSEFQSDKPDTGPGLSVRQDFSKTLAQAQSAGEIDRSAGRTAEPVLRGDADRPGQSREVPVPLDFGRTRYTQLPKPKEEEPKGWSIPVRAVAAIGLGLLGFALPLLFIPAALIALSIFGEIAVRNEERIPDYVDPRAQLTASVPNWRDHWLMDCESPAEEAFLHAMVGAFGLVPEQEQLRNGGITLLLQVQIPPYRADFMMGNRLIVEVDGAAYHSSPEAIARDAQRDEFLVSEGFTVLRIPAKVVLRDPAETARRVRHALETLPPITPKAKPAKASPSVVGTLSTIKEKAVAFDKALADGSQRMSALAVQAEAEKIERKKWLEDLAKWTTDPKFHEELHERVKSRLLLKRQAEESLMDLGVSPLSKHPGSADRFQSEDSIKMDERNRLIMERKISAAEEITDAEGQPRLLKTWDARETEELVHAQRQRVAELNRRVIEKTRKRQGINQEQEFAALIRELPPYELGELEFELRRMDEGLRKADR